MNLREALHMCELRTMPQGHPDYRFICQEMWRKIQEVHPTLAEAGKFMAEVALRPAAVGDADGIQEIGVGRDRIGEAKLKNILWAAPTAF